MNIFFLHRQPRLASRYHCDKHIVKMPLETAQMLCTAHWATGKKAPYKATHKNHPCNVWLCQSVENYIWLSKLGKELCTEYTYRYGRVHACEKIIDWCIENIPSLPKIQMTSPALAMPDYCKTEDPVQSYRIYYILDKGHLHNWSKRQTPNWIKSK